MLKSHYDITKDLEGKKFAGIDLEWTYARKHIDRQGLLSMNGYIENVLIKHGHTFSGKCQLSPHKYQDIQYGAKQQLAPDADTSLALNEKEVQRVQ